MADGLFIVSSGLGVSSIEGMLGKFHDLGRTETETEEIIEEEIVQLVWSHEVFGLLADIALFVGWNQFRTDGGFDDIGQYLTGLGIGKSGGKILDEIADKGLGNASVHTIHRHVVAVISGPAQGQFTHVASADNESAHLVGHIHKNLSALAGLSVLVGHIMLIHVMADIQEMLGDALGDADFAQGHSQPFHEHKGIVMGAVGGAESGHGDADDAAAVEF